MVVTISLRCCPDLTAIVKPDVSGWGNEVMMNTNQGLAVFESVLARLNAALDLAASELTCSNAAEKRIDGMVSRLLNEECANSATKVIRLPQRPLSHAANENQADCDELFGLVSGAPLSIRAAC
jgi:hypothetical protein